VTHPQTGVTPAAVGPGPGSAGRPLRSCWSRLRAAFVLAAVLSGLAAVAGSALAQPAGPTVVTTEVQGPITPVIADHLAETLEEAATAGHEAVVITLDTPGGGLDPTRKIVQAFLDAPLPVVVHVAPPGADAGSAGTFITYAAHVAAMAPATTIGAATPVDLEGQEVGDKIVNNTVAFAEAIAEERGRDPEFAAASVRDGRSITASVAVEEGAVDLEVGGLADLLEEIDGTEVEVRGSTVTLETAGATPVEMNLGGARALLQLLANPNLAFIFMTLGTLGILYEIANPGMGLGGLIGAICLVLLMFSLAVLPVAWAGAALLLLAVAMFIAELFMPGVGVGAAGGTIALLLGGIFLFETPTGISLDWWVLIPTVITAFVLCVLAGRLVARAHRGPSRVASDYLIGRTVVVERASEGRPRGRLDGTWWQLTPNADDVALRDGERYTVVDRDNLQLIVAPEGAATPANEE
jgi:membrane-bound serine protease (ClpP class)